MFHYYPSRKYQALVFLAMLATVPLAGCGSISSFESAITGVSVKPQAVLVAANTFDALETVGTGYISLPLCASGAPVTCRDAAASASIVKAVRTGRTPRDELLKLLKANSGAAIPVASLDTLNAAIATLQSVYSQYNIQH